MPDKLQQKQLMEPQDGPSKDAAGTEADPAGTVPGSTPMDSMDEMKANLKAFTDSVHQKGSQLVAMIQGVEGQNTARSNQFLPLRFSVLMAIFLLFSSPSIGLVHTWGCSGLCRT